MSQADLHIELREKTGHQTAKWLRRTGLVPGLFYAHGEDSIPFSVKAKGLQRLLHSEVNVLNIIFPDGKTKKSIVREVQHDPVTDAVMHIDVMGIKLTEKIHMTIPLVLTGTPVGIKEGGILEHLLREVEVEGFPLEIPDHIEIDVSSLKIGDVITLENIAVDKIKILTEPYHAVANVIHPKVVKTEAEVSAEEEVVSEEEEEKEKGKEKVDSAAEAR